MTRVHSTCASGASAIGVPGWPEFAFCTASIAKPRMTLTPSWSRSCSVAVVVVTGGPLSSLCGRSAGEPTGGPAPAGPLRLRGEQGQAGGEPVHVVAPPDGPDLAGAERTGQRDRPEQLLHQPGVVVGEPEQVPAPAVTGEEERAVGTPGAGQEHAQVLVGAARVPHLELHGLTDLDDVTHRQRSGVLVAAEDVPDEEVAAAELVPLLVDDDAEMQSLPEQRPLLVTRRRGQLLQARERGLAAQLVHEVGV